MRVFILYVKNGNETFFKRLTGIIRETAIVYHSHFLFFRKKMLLVGSIFNSNGRSFRYIFYLRVRCIYISIRFMAVCIYLFYFFNLSEKMRNSSHDNKLSYTVFAIHVYRKYTMKLMCVYSQIDSIERHLTKVFEQEIGPETIIHYVISYWHFCKIFRSTKNLAAAVMKFFYCNIECPCSNSWTVNSVRIFESQKTNEVREIH